MSCAVALAAATSVLAQQPVTNPASALRARYRALHESLETSPIQKGLHVESTDASRAPRGDAYAVVEYPFATVAGAFQSPAILCESLILHLNVQYCRGAEPGDAPGLQLALGKKTSQPLEDTHLILLHFKLQAESDEFMRVELTAKNGPLSTGNYLIAMELVALDEQHAFMHIQYAYTQGILARIATSLYFATGGREKVGFTAMSDSGSDAPQLVHGIRGVLERNTMRYYLAFNAYLQTLYLPAPQRFEASLERWFADTERFSRQLHELPHDEYIAMKRGQYRRQQVTLQASR